MQYSCKPIVWNVKNLNENFQVVSLILYLNWTLIYTCTNVLFFKIFNHLFTKCIRANLVFLEKLISFSCFREKKRKHTFASIRVLHPRRAAITQAFAALPPVPFRKLFPDNVSCGIGKRSTYLLKNIKNR